MLVTPERSRRNRNHAFALAGAMAMASAVAGWFWPPALLSLGLCPLIYWLVRRRCVRRLRIMEQPFPASWEQVLQSHVAFFLVLSAHEKERFRQLVKEPQLYAMLQEMFHQDTFSLLKLTPSRRPRYGRNAPCPCGSGKKYKHCCLRKAIETTAANTDRQTVSGLGQKA
jgi:hypothetical protein